MTKVIYDINEEKKQITASTSACKLDLVIDIEKDIKRGKLSKIFETYFEENKDKGIFDITDEFSATVTCDENDEFDIEKGKKAALLKLIRKVEYAKYKTYLKAHELTVKSIYGIEERVISYVKKINDFTLDIADMLGYIDEEDTNTENNDIDEEYIEETCSSCDIVPPSDGEVEEEPECKEEETQNVEN